jgi:undecaprenyl pyrophosphate synthase
VKKLATKQTFSTEMRKKNNEELKFLTKVARNFMEENREREREREIHKAIQKT